jgi:membrane-bound ClpP family serine protease
MRRMAASVLVFEAFIALFFGLVAAKLHPSDDWIVAVVLGGACILLSGLMRFRWAYYAGWVLQIGFVGAGFLVTDMFVLGLLFTAIWWAGLHFGAKAERIRAEHSAAQQAAVPDEAPHAAPDEASYDAATSTDRPGVTAR